VKIIKADSIKKIPILMIGIAIPPKLMSELAALDTIPGMQGFNHQWSTIRGIETAAGQPINLISFPMVTDFPKHPRKYIKGGRWQHHPDSKDIYIPVLNIFPLKLIFRFLVMFYEIFQWFWINRSTKQRIVILYSSQSSQLYALIILTLFFKSCNFAILTDPLSMDLPGERFIRKTLRRIDRFAQRFALKKLKGLIVLTEGLALDFAPGVPYLVVEGVSPQLKKINENLNDSSSKLIVAYAGTLKKEYDIESLLNSLQYLDNEIELWIFGGGELANEVREVAVKDSRLKYFGFLQPEELRLIAQNASAFISHLPTNGWYTRYKFPSKILEYMSMGKPVISTRYPTIPKEYDPYLIWIEDESAKGIAKAIKTLQAMSSDERKMAGKR